MVKKETLPISAVKPKHAGGRPTKYRPELCDDIIKFFDRPLYVKKITRKWVDGEEQIIEQEVPNETPFLARWCRKHKINVTAPSEWAHKYPEFSKAIIDCKAIQEAFLVEHGIKGDHNGFMTFQTLKNVSGWRDKHEVESKSEVRTIQEIIVKYETMSNEQLTDAIMDRINGHKAKLN